METLRKHKVTREQTLGFLLFCGNLSGCPVGVEMKSVKEQNEKKILPVTKRHKFIAIRNTKQVQ